jgi:mannose-6-phosphate isomerase-like protein (cupin superfamily)
MNEPCKINTIGDKVVFNTTAGDEAGGYTEMLAALPKCTEEKSLHIHPLQTVKLEPIEGKLGIMLPDRRLVIKPGRSFEIPKNTEFAFYNADEKEIKFKSTLTPALHTEWLTKEMVASAKRKKSKLLSQLERSYIISQIKGEYYKSGLPVAVQNIVHSSLAFVGKMIGIHKQVSPVY